MCQICPNSMSQTVQVNFSRTLVPNTIKGMVFGTRDLKYCVLAPFGCPKFLGSTIGARVGFCRKCCRGRCLCAKASPGKSGREFCGTSSRIRETCRPLAYPEPRNMKHNSPQPSKAIMIHAFGVQVGSVQLLISSSVPLAAKTSIFASSCYGNYR